MRGWEKVPHKTNGPENCRMLQGRARFGWEVVPEQPVERVLRGPCKQRRLQPLQCRTLLEVREGACRARQREWYRRELEGYKVFVSWQNRGQGLFLFPCGPALAGNDQKVEKG